MNKQYRNTYRARPESEGSGRSGGEEQIQQQNQSMISGDFRQAPGQEENTNRQMPNVGG